MRARHWIMAMILDGNKHYGEIICDRNTFEGSQDGPSLVLYIKVDYFFVRGHIYTGVQPVGVGHC